MRSAIRSELDGLAALDEKDLAPDSAELFREGGVAEKLAVFSVDGNEVFRLHQLQQDLHLFLAGVAGDVDRGRTPAFVIDQHATAEQVIDHAENVLFVSWDYPRGENDGVILFDGHEAVIVHGDARERGERLGLRSAGQHHQLLRIEAFNILRTNDAAIGNAQFAEFVRDFDVVDHAAADDADFAADHPRNVNDLLDAMDGARKAGDDHFLGRGAE